MKTQISILAAAGVSVLLAGCGNAKGTDGFAEPVPLAADSIAVNQIVKPACWAVCNGKAVVVSENTDSVFYVYRLPDFRFLYTWGRRGSGPGEFPNQVRFVDGDDGDTGMLTTVNGRNKSFDAFEAGGREMALKKTSSMFRESVFLDDRPLPCGWMAAKKVAGDKEYLCVRSARDGSVQDSVALYTWVVKADYDDKGRLYSLSRMNSPRIIAKDDRIAVVYQNFVRVDFYRVNDRGKLSLLGTAGEPIDGAALQRLRVMRNETRQHGIMGCFSTGKYLYTLYLDIELDRETNHADILQKIVHVYDWNGKQVRAFDLEKPATDILVSGDDRLLYTRNFQEDFDRVYVYRLPE